MKKEESAKKSKNVKYMWKIIKVIQTSILPVMFFTVQKSIESKRTTETKTPMKLELNIPPKR